MNRKCHILSVNVTKHFNSTSQLRGHEAKLDEAEQKTTTFKMLTCIHANIFQRTILTRKVRQTDLVFGVQ